MMSQTPLHSSLKPFNKFLLLLRNLRLLIMVFVQEFTAHGPGAKAGPPPAFVQPETQEWIFLFSNGQKYSKEGFTTHENYMNFKLQGWAIKLVQKEPHSPTYSPWLPLTVAELNSHHGVVRPTGPAAVALPPFTEKVCRPGLSKSGAFDTFSNLYHPHLKSSLATRASATGNTSLVLTWAGHPQAFELHFLWNALLQLFVIYNWLLFL